MVESIGRKQTDSSSTRERILVAARDLFSSLGYDATSIRMVARACGLTNPAVHYHFRTKRDLYDALLSQPLPTGSRPPNPTRLGAAAAMEQRFADWVDEVPFVRLLLRQQLAGEPNSIEFLQRQEAAYLADMGEWLAPLYGEANARYVASMAFDMLCGAFWDVLLSYGEDAEDVMRQDYFRARVRNLIEAALESAGPEAP